MKYVLSFLGLGIIIFSIFMFGGKNNEYQHNESVRIHVIANSNSKQDEEIKYFVKDVLVEFLKDKLEVVESKEEAKKFIKLNILKLQNIVNKALENYGVEYTAKIRLTKENMPTRAYDDVVYVSDEYDSLRIELGQAKGDNWWCVVFPSVCFISSKNFENYEYKSKIWEIISSVI